MKLYYKGMIAVHLENGAVTTRTLPVPLRPEGFALLRLLAAGICNTDLELERGYYAFAGTPGHEFVAEVVETDTPSLTGKRVVARSTSPARIANGAARAWAATAPTAPCWESSATPAPPPSSSPSRSAICTFSPTTYPPAAPSSWSRWPPPARSWTRYRSPPARPSPCWAMANSASSSPWSSTPTAAASTNSAATPPNSPSRRARAARATSRSPPPPPPRPHPPARPPRRQPRHRGGRGRRGRTLARCPSHRRQRLGGRCHRQPRR